MKGFPSETRGTLLAHLTSRKGAFQITDGIFETNEGASGAVADECVRMWMQSEGHRLNMLSPEFDKTGIAVGISSIGENYITEDFAH